MTERIIILNKLYIIFTSTDVQGTRYSSDCIVLYLYKGAYYTCSYTEHVFLLFSRVSPIATYLLLVYLVIIVRKT